MPIDLKVNLTYLAARTDEEADLALDVEAPEGGWAGELRAATEDRLLLLEAAHRVANEVAAALAALRMVRPVTGSRPRWRLLAGAAARLEGFAQVNRLLAIPDGAEVALAGELGRLCEGLAAGRTDGRRDFLDLDLDEVVVGGAIARRVLMVAAELLLNAIRHGLRDGAGRVTLALRGDAAGVTLAVSDDGPGMDAASAARGSGMGGHIVAELVRRGGGAMECRSGPDGTSLTIAFPLAPVPVRAAAVV